MLRLGIAAFALTALVFAEGFTFNIGSPVASQDYQAKGASFVFRTQGCAEPAKAKIDGTAEGLKTALDARRLSRFWRCPSLAFTRCIAPGPLMASGW